MATKSIILVDTKIVKHFPSIGMASNEAYPEDIEFTVNYTLKENVQNWCMNTLGYCKFNTRKGRIKFVNESDAALFKLTWL